MDKDIKVKEETHKKLVKIKLSSKLPIKYIVEMAINLFENEYEKRSIK